MSLIWYFTLNVVKKQLVRMYSYVCYLDIRIINLHNWKLILEYTNLVALKYFSNIMNRKCYTTLPYSENFRLTSFVINVKAMVTIRNSHLNKARLYVRK